MSDDFNYPAAVPPPPGATDPIPPLIPSSSPPPRRQRRDSNPLLNWALAAVIVLILAVAGGLITAWLVANSRAVPEPVAFATARPTQSVSFCPCPTASPGPTAEPTEGPRFTPSPPATPEITSPPFTHIVAAGESLTYIAGIYQVAVQDIMDLNDIKNPNRIFIGQKLLIPGYGVHPTEKPTKPPK